MREFIYYSGRARTSGNFDTSELMQAGRMDIVCNVIISALFLSHKMREDVHLHLIFMGQPTPPRHLEFISNKEMPISKKDVAGLIKVMLYKCREGERREIFPGCFVEKKSFQQVINELESDGKNVLVMDKKGRDIRDIKDDDINKAVWIIGDEEGLPKKEIKRHKDRISIGPEIYFASQTLTILNNEIDRRQREN